MIYFDATQKLVFESYTGAASVSTLPTLTSFAINQWYHITLTVKATPVTADWYVNGVLDSGTATGTVAITQVTRLYNYIGLNVMRNTPGLNAIIDDLKIFNIPLSIAQIVEEKMKSQPYKIITLEYVNVYNLPSSYTPGLTFYWPLSNNFVDYINYKDLIDHSENAFTFDRFDTPNSALLLDSSYLTAPTFNYFNNTGVTIMTWIKLLHPNGVSVNTEFLTILDFGDGCNYNNIKFQLVQSTDTQTYTLRFMTYLAGVAAATPYVSTLTIRVGEWHHIAVSYVSSVSVIFYVDGVADTASVGPFTLPATFTSYLNFIGRSCDVTDSNDLTAVLDEFKIFNKALSQISRAIADESNVKEPFSFNQVQTYSAYSSSYSQNTIPYSSY